MAYARRKHHPVNNWLSVAVIVLVVAIAGIAFWIPSINKISLPELPLPLPQAQVQAQAEVPQAQIVHLRQDLDSFFTPDKRPVTCDVMGGYLPPHLRFTSFKVGPWPAPPEGSIQAFSFWIVSEESPVNEVTATIKTTTGTIVIPFNLVEGNNKDGRWTGGWVLKNVLWVGSDPQYLGYMVNLRAVNEKGDEDSLTFGVANYESR